MPFTVLFPGETIEPDARLVQLEGTGKRSSKRKTKVKGSEGRGCEYCTLNKVHGVVKIMGEVTGKDIAVFAQSPGPDENAEAKRLLRKHKIITGIWDRGGAELVGKSGEWWWAELGRVGITRDDVDIQNAERCFPADSSDGTYDSYLKMRNPTPHEIKCCSLHTENMLPKLKAKQILVLGVVAAKQLLETRSLPKQKIFWSDKLKARIYLLDHPSYFIRGYASAERLQAFRDLLDMVAADRKKTGKSLSDRYAFIKQQDYRLIRTRVEALAARDELREYAKKGINIAQDIEDAEWEGKRRIVACGFSPKPGLSYVFVFKHREQHSDDGNAVLEIVKTIVEDTQFNFAYQYGCSDVEKWKKYEDVRPVNFEHDTNLSEYLRFSNRNSYALDAIAEARFPKFSGYKTIVAGEMLNYAMEWRDASDSIKVPESIVNGTPEAKMRFVESKKLFDINALSLDTLRLYNGADCDLTKRIEVSNKKYVLKALMKLYIDFNFILAKMEPKGPLYDYSQSRKLAKLYPTKERKLRRRLCKLVGNKEFNPGSPQQVYDVMYNQLELEFPDGHGKRGKVVKPNTQKRTMLLLAREHKFPQLMLEWRPVSKMKSTLDGYKKCADIRKGRLRTKWWSTGARTGRMASGKGKSKEEGLVNLQNMKKDAQVKNLCIADKEWKQFYDAAVKILQQFKYSALRANWAELREWEALSQEERKETPKPKLGTGAIQNLADYGNELQKWVEENLPELKTFLCYDYGQVEVRVMAQMSGDKNLKADCAESDIHTRVGVTMTGWDADRIRKDEQTRTLTKNVHFGIMFGLSKDGLYSFVVAMSPPDMAGRITREQIDEAVDNYFKRYKGVLRFHETQREFARENKCVYTMFGMRQELRITDDDVEDEVEIEDDIEKVRTSYWGNQCINGPVQGTAHQLMICALVNLLRKRKKYKELGIPPMEVHDALNFGVKVLELLKMYLLGKYLLEKESVNTAKKDFNINFDVPIVVEAKAGLRLGCVIDLDGVKSVGEFLAKWVYRCMSQVRALNQELKEVTA